MPQPTDNPPRPDFWLFCPKLPDEPGDAYEALYEWALLGEHRSISGLIRSLKKKWGNDRDQIPGPLQIDEWILTWGWENRIARYDRESRYLDEAQKSEQWHDEAGEAQRLLLRVSMRLLAKAEQIAQLPIVEQRIERDGKTTIVKPLRVSARDAITIAQGAQEILDKIRPRSMPEELMESLGVYLKGMDSGVLSPTQCETIARHLASMKAELEAV